MRLVLINPRNPVSLYGEYLWQPLAFGYVAAVTPPHWTVELIDEQVEGARDYGGLEADLVGLTAFTTQAPRAYEIAAQLRSRGIPVVMGGIHASLVQDEAAQHADALFIGECETL
ncbi:MAG: radical SAM protein, partial [Acidimicrobiia bacterium]|nr:radical SAM protein [Acidimicrobiia bacterium]